MILDSFLPNPIGKDIDGEWIKLFNNGDETINLSGWQLKDASGKTFVFKEQKIKPGEYLLLGYKTTKISLNNNGEAVFLYNQNGELISQLEYSGHAEEGKIFYNQNQNPKELSASLINPVLNNQLINTASKFSLKFIGIDIFLALILAFIFIFLLKKIDLLSD